MQINLDKETVVSLLEQLVNQIKDLFDKQFPDIKDSHKNYLFTVLIIIGFFLVSKLVGFLFKFAIIFIIGAFVGFYAMKKMKY